MAGESRLIDELRRRGSASEQEAAGDGGQAERFQRARPAEEPPGGEAVEDEVNAVAYGYYRGVRERATHVEFQRLKGSWPAPGYTWLPCPVWAPSGTGKGRGQAILLEYVTGLKVTIRGRNLRPLYDRLLRQQVFRVTEMGEEADNFLPEEASVVYAIDVAEPEREKE